MKFILPLLMALITTAAHATPLVGSIRWDAWYGSDGPVTALEKSLGPPKYHFRLPWFATVTGEATVKIDGDRPEIMAREIEWAATAGLDYWAFVDYGDSGALSRGLRGYLAADDKRGVKFCFVEEGERLDGSDLAKMWPRLVGHFQRADYVKVLDGRPLLFVFGPPKKLAKQEFDDLAERCRKAGLARPYLVFMGWNPEADNKTREELGFDAVSAYGAHGAYDKQPPSFADLAKGVEQGRWETCRRLKIPCVTFATSGWDTRPRIENPPPWINWVKADPDPTPPAQQTPLHDAATATPAQLAAHIKNAVTWTQANRDINLSNAILIYAWNENDEGGWLMPTRGANGQPDDSRILALRGVLR